MSAVRALVPALILVPVVCLAASTSMHLDRSSLLPAQEFTVTFTALDGLPDGARIGGEIAHRVALRLGNALQARTIPIGVWAHHLAFGATVSIKGEASPDTLADFLVAKASPALSS
jgi:hypothetical protein